MRRELWVIGNAFANGVRILNSIFCTDCKKEPQLSEDEKWLLAEQINSMCSSMMIEDAQEMLVMVGSMTAMRLCERTDCLYHHSEFPQTHAFGNMFKDKCNECLHNEKSRIDPDNKMEHFESV